MGGPFWTDPSETMAALRRMATPGAQLLLFPGCGALGRRPVAVLAAGRAFDALGVAFDVLPEHRCCGMPALTFGDTDALAEMHAGARDAVRTTAATTVAVQSPSCSYLLGVRQPLDGVQVEPLAATFARALSSRQHTSERRVAYHDPCYLARHQRRRDEPRSALTAAGYAVAELHRRGDTTQCSGQGGGLPITHPDIAAGYLRLLTDEVHKAGVDEVVTGCASCAAALSTTGVNAKELAEAIAAAVAPQEGG